MALQLSKRPAEDDGPYGKRGRYDTSVVLSGNDESRQQRSSSLQSPIMLLTGHGGEIFTSRFSGDGTCLASGGYDQKIFLWNVHGDCENFSTLKGHAGAVMDLAFSTDCKYDLISLSSNEFSFLFSCGTDNTVRIWDMEDGRCIRKFKSHQGFVNSCHPARRGPTIVVSGGEDGKIFIHDIRAKEAVSVINSLQNFPVTAVTFNDNSQEVIAGGIDSTLKRWDIRRGLLDSMPGHEDTITSLALSPDGRHVLSNSMDCTARIWDIQPFASGNRLVKVFHGHQHNFERNLLKCAWSPDSTRITVGSSDRFTYVFNINRETIEYKLPGHQGSVNAVDFHPTEPILLSAGSDKRIYLGEIEPSNQPKIL